MCRRVLWLPLLLCLLFCGCSPQPSSEALSSVVINEVQTSGDEYDWIEFYNPSGEAVSLGGCFLSNDPKEPGKWQFPAVTIEAGGYVLVCADDVINDGRLCAPFRLNAGGTTLRLSAHSGAVLQELTVPAGASGLSYGKTDNGYAWYASPTPNADNRNGLLLGEQKTVEQYGLRINEYMSRNRSVLYDENGDYSDWIELRNFSDKDIDL
ncbi:MAG: lamin tail domain-containing protein, partial [Clostridia bacterium]|nr:lamin tail domain-containing protein [Clostridia bacterium]